MSVLDYRDWDISLNPLHSEAGTSFDGYFECVVHDYLMVRQSVEFLAECYLIKNRKFVNVERLSQEKIHESTQTKDGKRCIRIYENLDMSKNIEETVQVIKCFIDSLAISVDAPLSCYKISFFSPNLGEVFQSNRKQIGRGFSFRVDERGLARTKLSKDFEYFQDKTDQYLIIGQRHYMAGMQLLALEDHSSGLIDAAFMQFYQGCEVLCRGEKGTLNQSKMYIASKNIPDSKNLQIIAHQIWQVRNKYFGHGDVGYNQKANEDREQSKMVAKQVLVARYLCRRLIEIDAPSNTVLVREMVLYFAGHSGNFTGQLQQLLGEFKVAFDHAKCFIFAANGSQLETFQFPE